MARLPPGSLVSKVIILIVLHSSVVRNTVSTVDKALNSKMKTCRALVGRNRNWWKMEEVCQEQEARQGRG